MNARSWTLVGLFALVEFQLELWLLVPAGTPSRGVAALVLVALAVALGLAPRAPLGSLLVVVGSVSALSALPDAYYEHLVLPYVSTFGAAFWLGRRGGRAALVAGLALAVPIALFGVSLTEGSSRPGALFTVAVAVGAPLVIGRVLRSREALNGALREKAALLARRRANAAGRAVADERARIAGELHDVVAHALSAMTVQATGARRLALTRPAQAREAFGAIEGVGREALDELRRLLGVLRRDDGPPRPLIGTRERVELHGGRLTTTGRTVRATLPLEGQAIPTTAPPNLKENVKGTVPFRLRSGVVDAVAAAVLAVAAIAEVVTVSTREGSLLANIALALAYTLPIAWRRRAPVAALGVTIAALLAMSLLATTAEDLFVPFLVVLAIAYAGAAHREGREAKATLALVVAGVPAIVATMNGQSLADFFFPTLIGVMAWVAGRAVRSRTRLVEQLHEAAAQLAEASEAERRAAAVDERRRIARELHDLVAHSISVMVVQAGGARRILGRDPSRALEAATRIERTGREALSEMRNLLGMLAAGDERPALAPQPTLGEAGELVARARAAGLPATLVVHGERRALPAGLDLAAYRIVQEALTNAIKHAPGAPTTVTVAWEDSTLALEVRDAGGGLTSGDGGHGLVGMRERVRLYDGELEAGPVPGGWRVRATLPLEVRELALS